MLSRLFRRLFLTALHDAFEDGHLRVSGSLQALSDPQGFADYLQPARHTEWVVYAKPPFAGPHQVLDYVGRYTHRVAIANQRLLDMDDGHVRFRYTDDRAQASQTTMTLDATAFIRRVLLHVLPSGFHRIRYDGLLGHRHRREHLARCRHLLGTVARPERVDDAATSADYRDRDEALTGCSLRVCPRGHNGQMRIVERLVGAPTRPRIVDTS